MAASKSKTVRGSRNVIAVHTSFVNYFYHIQDIVLKLDLTTNVIIL